MKVFDSGMPEEKIWNSFFDVNLIIKEMLIDSHIVDIVEIGSGYGTFTLPAARQISGKVYAFDIESEMIDHLNKKINTYDFNNIIPKQRDILTQTTGLADGTVDYVMLFNILHHDSPADFFNECLRILKPEGKVGIIHWRSDIPTPRGPNVDIRPKPEQIKDWIDKSQIQIIKPPFIINPYHFGLVLSKK